MPLSTKETKALLINIFRLSMAVAEKRTGDAIDAYSKIVDTAVTDSFVNDSFGNDAFDDDEMPELIPFVQATHDDIPQLIPVYKTDSPDIDLIISEIKTAVPTLESTTVFGESGKTTSSAPLPSVFNCDEDNIAIDEDFDVDASAADEESADEESASDEEEEEEEEEEEVEEEEEAEEEAVELDLEPVRIKKVIYWKDVNSGDIYTSLPNDEVGDKVGSYVDGKPVFA